MKKLKVKDLIKKYPKIFRQSKLPMTETCMCWGIETGDGWYTLLDNLCRRLQWDIDKNNYPQLETAQVKEKFGGLRFYYDSVQGEYERLVTSGKISQKEWDRKCGAQDAIISIYEELSNQTCEQCGRMDDVKQTTGWIRTLCKKCIIPYGKTTKDS